MSMSTTARLKPPPNAPCPCGATDTSGKSIKFKKCHGKTL
jgi:hypothetical protein